MGHSGVVIQALDAADLRARRLRAIEELLAAAEVRVVDAEEGLAVVERARKPAAIRMCREDLAAAEAQREVLLHARTLTERAAAAERGEAA